MTARLQRPFRLLLAPVLVCACIAFALTRSTGPASAATGDAFVRINQVGYVDTSTKRAYLIASVAETGGTFNVRNSSNTTVYSGSIGPDLGRWSNAYPHVYALDFTALSTPGTGYTIVISPPASAPAATSPAFRIDNGTALYATAIANSLNYYQVQRDGPDYVPSA